jgi:hypothetical protein
MFRQQLGRSRCFHDTIGNVWLLRSPLYYVVHLLSHSFIYLLPQAMSGETTGCWQPNRHQCLLSINGNHMGPEDAISSQRNLCSCQKASQDHNLSRYQGPAATTAWLPGGFGCKSRQHKCDWALVIVIILNSLPYLYLLHYPDSPTTYDPSWNFIHYGPTIAWQLNVPRTS